MVASRPSSRRQTEKEIDYYFVRKRKRLRASVYAENWRTGGESNGMCVCVCSVLKGKMWQAKKKVVKEA